MPLDLTEEPTVIDREDAIATLRWYEQYAIGIAELRVRQATAAQPAILRSETLAREGLAFRADAAALARSILILEALSAQAERLA